MEVPKPKDGHGWLMDGNGNIVPHWFDGDCLPKLLIDDDDVPSDDDYEDDGITMNELDDKDDEDWNDSVNVTAAKRCVKETPITSHYLYENLPVKSIFTTIALLPRILILLAILFTSHTGQYMPHTGQYMPKDAVFEC